MKKLLSLSITMFCALGLFANSSTYYVDDSAIEEKLTSSTQVVFDASSVQFGGAMMDVASIQQSDPNAWVAFLITWAVGGLGIHRVYLGGKGSLILIYIVTCFGIFGIVPLIDWIVLLVGAIKGDISSFVDNDSFFMWAGN